MAIVVDIADAVVAALNGQTFSQPFTAARAYRAAFDLQDMKNLHVTVVPKGMELTTAGAPSHRTTCRSTSGCSRNWPPATTRRSTP